ncbi:hypothetical protein E2P84_43010 [Burkholderia cepacia]|uniref:DUF551 domain-containing protein n=1 Tax=Burkholderia cepacia TaxID=292 RepID=A0AAX2RR17_BURCE|nr:hypothetical protein [Burkholderia cepacia]TES61933.1 hypothetical protein E2P84_43010 [Burkholderia cepacia]TET01732.1 hypothetical protein E3D36_17000 [Burkholderia cepacia]TEU47590.1 hypothetical protein E3D37_16430 [Burkholderia cepacia]TEU53462.1 hypothetical protein E3D38_12015 [Burkholderia cepacia]TEV02068.1 hypothetical protein E3D40_12945 [Burkholderia cepacia]
MSETHDSEDWFPIVDAPHDGTEIRVACFLNRHYRVWERRAVFRGSKWRPVDGVLDVYLKPTHWLPV